MWRLRGQSMLEMLWVLPLVMFLGCATVQLLWLFLTHQMLQSATVFMVRQSSIDGARTTRQLETLYQAMRPLPGTAMHVPLIIRLQPSDSAIIQYAEPVTVEGQRYYRLTTDFNLVRMQGVRYDAREAWLRSRIIQYEVVWCQPLKVPIAAPIMAYFLSYSVDAKQQYCNMQRAGREPMKAVTSRAAAALQGPLDIPWGAVRHPDH